ncbi:gamma-glutamyl-gamma-aminobutyrate hydrolase family protein [Microbacterium sp. 22215]|uniref:gamma-glutamyl-gamma-aminobutyrate hydrolase family protein n=1 Tax=Microbacterium sp. 22215 TaxID=3453893 RepID=UPI003F874658
MSVHVALFHVRTRRQAAAVGYQTLLDGLNASAVAAIERVGWTTSLHAAGEAPEPQLKRASREADVIVLLGGDDIEPLLYGQSDRRPQRTAYQRRADRTQIAVVMEAVRSRRPLLGVCRGMQLLNVALGGTLHQHVGGHRGAGVDPFVATDLKDLDAVSPRLRHPLLCTHHQAVDELGHGLRAIARSHNGVVEAVEHESLPFLGVQWHPEHPSVAADQFTELLRIVHRRGAALDPATTMAAAGPMEVTRPVPSSIDRRATVVRH